MTIPHSLMTFLRGLRHASCLVLQLAPTVCWVICAEWLLGCDALTFVAPDYQPRLPRLPPPANGGCPWDEARSIAARRAQVEDDSASNITETLANGNKSSPSILYQSHLALQKKFISFFLKPPARKRFTAVRIAHSDGSLMAEDASLRPRPSFQVLLCHHLAQEVPGRIHHPLPAHQQPRQMNGNWSWRISSSHFGPSKAVVPQQMFICLYQCRKEESKKKKEGFCMYECAGNLDVADKERNILEENNCTKDKVTLKGPVCHIWSDLWCFCIFLKAQCTAHKYINNSEGLQRNNNLIFLFRISCQHLCPQMNQTKKKK